MTPDSRVDAKDRPNLKETVPYCRMQCGCFSSTASSIPSIHLEQDRENRWPTTSRRVRYLTWPDRAVGPLSRSS